MTTVHEGAGHAGIVTLTLTEAQSDGGRVFQSWDLCSCYGAGLRARLGPPSHESVADAAAVRAIAATVLNQPGTVNILGGGE